MKPFIKIFIMLITFVLIQKNAPAKQPPTDLGYPPPAGWEFVMKLDSVSQFNIYAYNDTCFLTYNDGKGNNSGYKNLFSFDGGETWKTAQELGINLKGVEFIINSTAMHRISYYASDDSYYYEKSYDFFISVHQRNVIEKKSPKYQPYAVIQSPIDSNILILIFKYASGLAQIEDDFPFISRDAGRTWTVLKEIWHFGYTLFDFYFDLAQKGHWFANIGDGDNSESHINLGRYAAVNETYDDGLTFQLKKKGVPSYYTPEGPPIVGIDGKKTYRTWLGSKDGKYTSYYGIRITDYSDTIKTSKDYDWLTAMDPTKPKTNIDSGIWRSLMIDNYLFDNSIYKNNLINSREAFGDLKNNKDYKYIINSFYLSSDNGLKWELKNYFLEKPVIYPSYLDQKTKTVWILTIDDGFSLIKPQAKYHQSLWKLKLNWNSTEVKELNNGETLKIYPNPAIDKLRIKLQPKYSSYSIILIDLYGNEILSYKNIFATKESVFDIDLPAHLTSGTYFLKMMSENNISVRKFIVIK